MMMKIRNESRYLWGRCAGCFVDEGIKNVLNLVLINVTPPSLDCKTTQDRISVVIPRNTNIPVKKKNATIQLLITNLVP
jgi:molecular chaperone DnaK (HSP70)